jgi:hypothetical protein
MAPSASPSIKQKVRNLKIAAIIISSVKERSQGIWPASIVN